jgi:hypothetical protein
VKSLRQRCLARADGEMHLARSRQFLGELEAGVAPADDEHAPAWPPRMTTTS